MPYTRTKSIEPLFPRDNENRSCLQCSGFSYRPRRPFSYPLASCKSNFLTLGFASPRRRSSTSNLNISPNAAATPQLRERPPSQWTNSVLTESGSDFEKSSIAAACRLVIESGSLALARSERSVDKKSTSAKFIRRRKGYSGSCAGGRSGAVMEIMATPSISGSCSASALESARTCRPLAGARWIASKISRVRLLMSQLLQERSSHTIGHNLPSSTLSANSCRYCSQGSKNGNILPLSQAVHPSKSWRMRHIVGAFRNVS